MLPLARAAALRRIRNSQIQLVVPSRKGVCQSRDPESGSRDRHPIPAKGQRDTRGVSPSRRGSHRPYLSEGKGEDHTAFHLHNRGLIHMVPTVTLS